jgi:hypothetical protein
MRIVPISLKAANAFVERYHRHNKRVVTHKVSIGLIKGGELIGVGIGGHPISRMLDDGKTFEIRRVCVKPGHANACSKLLARLKRIAQLMGYEKLITYTLQKESGSSLRAVNGRIVAKAKHGNWERKGRPRRFQKVSLEPKYRWELHDENQGKET